MEKAPISGQIDLQGRVAIVTGAARGIGEAVCLVLAREGAKVAACDILSSEKTAASVSAMGHEAVSICCDISQKPSVEEVVNQVWEKWKRIDILVNNAGILGDSFAPFETYSVEAWDKLLNINLKGTFLMTQVVWPFFKAKGYGKIVCVGSIAGRIGGILAGPHYCASKGGIHSFVKWAAKRGAPKGIYVNGIAPGPIETPMTANEPYKDEMVPLGRLGKPEDIAEAALFLASQASNFITGKVLDVNGGMLMV